MMEEGPLDRQALSLYLPHEGPMLLIDRLRRWDIETLRFSAEVLARRDCVFFDRDMGGLPVWLAFEFMAQGIAALTGIKNERLGIKPRIGFILAVRDFQAEEFFFPVGSLLEISGKGLFDEGNLASYECELMRDGRLAAKAVVNAFETEMSA